MIWAFATAVTLAQMPEIAVSPQDQTVLAGSNVSFSVLATNISPVSYQWRFNTTNYLANATNATLMITNVAAVSAGGYDVVVTNTSGSVTSGVATLTVLLPPSIVQNPTSLWLHSGSTAIFSALADGTSPLSFQWFKGVTSLSDGGAVTGSTSNTLVISGVGAVDAANYQVVITNGYGSVTSTPVVLTIDDMAPTVVATIPSNGSNNVPVYAPVVVSFSEPMASGSINANSFTLQAGNNPPVAGTFIYDPATQRGIFTPSSSLAFRTTYTATVTTGATDLAGNRIAGNYTWNFTTAGLYEPDIGPVGLTAGDDNSTSQISMPFSVSIFGHVYNSFWINNNGNVTFTGAQSDFTAYAFPNNLGRVIIAPFFADVMTTAAGSGVVHYHNYTNRIVFTWDHVGYYNNHADKLNTFQLIITAPGQLGNLFGFSYDDMQWTTGDASSGSGGLGGSVARAGFDAGDGTNALVFWQGNSAASLLSIAHKTFWFTSYGSSPQANQPPVANAGSNQVVEQVSLAGTQVTLDGRGSTDDGLIRPLNYSWYEGAVQLGTGATLNYTFPWGVHNVTLVVDDGQFQTNSSVMITVRDTTPPDTIITGGPSYGSVIASRSATVSWSGSDNGCYPSNLLYSYSIDGAAASGFVTNTLVALNGLGDGPHTVSVMAQDLHGNVDPSPATLTFSVDATPPVITGVQSTPGVTQDQVAWVTDKTTTSQIEYGLTAGYGSVTTLSIALVTSHNQTISDLRPATTYHYRIHSKDYLGNEGITADATFTTLPDITPPDTQFTFGPGQNSTACSLPVSFGWTGTDNATVTTNLLFAYQIDGGGWSVFTNLTSLSLNSLTEGLHTIQVAAKDEAGNTDATPATVQFTVNALPPDISVIGTTPANTQCSVTWTTDEPATSQVEYGADAGYGSLTGLNGSLVASHTVVVPGLLPNLTYHFRVRSKDGCGHESLSSDSTFTTTPDITRPDTQFTAGPGQNSTACSLPVSFGWTGTDNATVT
ncbi:MAG: Ig-like domain-containing protein, partial [Verrucomicrobiota bacterium]